MLAYLQTKSQHQRAKEAKCHTKRFSSYLQLAIYLGLVLSVLLKEVSAVRLTRRSLLTVCALLSPLYVKPIGLHAPADVRTEEPRRALSLPLYTYAYRSGCVCLRRRCRPVCTDGGSRVYTLEEGSAVLPSRVQERESRNNKKARLQRRQNRASRIDCESEEPEESKQAGTRRRSSGEREEESWALPQRRKTTALRLSLMTSITRLVKVSQPCEAADTPPQDSTQPLNACRQLHEEEKECKGRWKEEALKKYETKTGWL